MKNTYDKIPGKTRQRNWSARQRKKFHVGEFQMMIFRVKIVFKEAMADEPFEVFIDQFIEFVEANDLCLGAFGGRLPIKETVGVIDSLDGKRSMTKDDRRKVSSFLHNHEAIESVIVEQLRDAYYGWNQKED
jgi:uncharacterized protein YggL (DUF469 family)